MKGLDLAFYARRSKYHTMDDSVDALGGTESLWYMLRLALGGGKALAEVADDGEDAGRGFYFDCKILSFQKPTYCSTNAMHSVQSGHDRNIL